MMCHTKKLLAFALCLTHCTSSDAPSTATDKPVQLTEGACQAGATAPEFLKTIGCRADFTALASQPINADLPGARSTKVILDTADNNALYFQNSQLYPIHYEFASSHLSGNGLPLVEQLSQFNTVEYYRPDRRFILGAVTYYDDPKQWTLEVSPYDTASAAQLTTLYQAVSGHAYFGPALAFHPTSENVAVEAKKLAPNIQIVTTTQLYANTSYQPLTLGSTVGRLHFTTTTNLNNGEYLPYEAIVVLDEAPNDITAVRGLITQEFQTPLSHVNVLSQNRRTPNMGLRDAMSNAVLKALDGQLVELTVTATEWTVRAATQAEADAFWAAHQPQAAVLPTLDVSVKGLYDIEAVTPETAGISLRDALKTAIHAFGGKAAHYSILAKTPGLPVPKAFAIPMFYYDQFMRENGLYTRLDVLLADATFNSEPQVRDQKLAEFRATMLSSPVDAELQNLLRDKFAKDYPGTRMRFRTSTNSEDLEGFPCAGCYESHTGDPDDWNDVLDAIRDTWASIWLYRTFEERNYYRVDHKSVGMALLVHHTFPDEEANGVAITNNPYDETGLEPGFFVNVQWGGEAEVVHPPPGVTSDQLLYFFSSPNQPVTYLTHSNLVPDGSSVLSARQVHDLGTALDAIHQRFSIAYGPASGNNGWYAMDVEFKFDNDTAPDQPAALWVKQARPYPGRGTTQ